MSYDVDLVVDTGAEQPVSVCDVGGPTYNLSPMFRLALGGDGLRDLDGRLAGDCIAALERAASHIRHPINRDAYVALTPSNGWGSHEGAASTLERLLAACRAHPKATVRIS